MSDTLTTAKANTVAFNTDYPDISRSEELYQRALGIMPPVTQTLAKGPSQHVNGVAPKFAERGKDGHIWDVDGNEYIDFNMGIGPLVLGYCYPRVDEAIREQLDKGITFSLMHRLEYEVSQMVCDIVPNAEMVRISKSGADVCSAAIRVARAFTGRNKVLCCGYHGWHDWYIATTARDYGIPQEVKALTGTFKYNDIESVKAALDADTAAVILEPFVFEEAKEGFLQELQHLCRANGTLLIFDEMWTGFRVALGGAQEFFGITPDLAVYSKAVANGMPIAFITGRKDVMQLFDKAVFFFTTFGGEALSLAATKATLLEMQEKNVQRVIWEKGIQLKEGYAAIVSELGMGHITGIIGYPCRTMITFSEQAGDPLLLKSYFQQELIKRGILWGGFHNVCFTHTQADINHTLAVYREVLPLLKDAVEKGDIATRLRGLPLEPVFRKVKF
jgi:glutamate-1-semialdehyde aminotransferase